MNSWWPRARSKLYEEPKKLAALGLAKATKEQVGQRPRTVFEITPAGRRALRAWLATPSAEGPVLEWEQLTKIFFADQGTATDAAATIAAAGRWAAGELARFADASRPYLAGDGPFPERLATNMVVGRFMVDYYWLVYQWSKWAGDVVERWPPSPRDARPDWEVLEEIVRRGDQVRRDQRAALEETRQHSR